jgi:arsenate reductase (glutaredoxin)
MSSPLCAVPGASELRLYGIAHCDTVKKARAFLAERAVACQFHDFKKLGIAPQLLERWTAALGWQPLVNRQGSTWRKLDEAARQRVVDAPSAIELMLSAPSVIKRPVVEWPDGATTVGFDAQAWSRRL